MRINRREFLLGLGTLGAAAVGGMTGCATDRTGNGRGLPELTSDHIDEPTYELPRGYRIPGGSVTPARPIPEPGSAGAIIARSAWATGGPIVSRLQPMNGVQLITFHHSGDPEPFLANDTAGTAIHLDKVRHFHISPVVNKQKPQGAGMCDIAYHYAIDRMGRVWELRNVTYQGEHVKDVNAHNLGVVVLGNFMLQPMTTQQQARVKVFAAALKAQYRVPVRKLWVHREIALPAHPTVCPGTNMYAWFCGERAKGGMGA